MIPLFFSQLLLSRVRDKGHSSLEMLSECHLKARHGKREWKVTNGPGAYSLTDLFQNVLQIQTLTVMWSTYLYLCSPTLNGFLKIPAYLTKSHLKAQVPFFPRWPSQAIQPASFLALAHMVKSKPCGHQTKLIPYLSLISSKVKLG